MNVKLRPLNYKRLDPNKNIHLFYQLQVVSDNVYIGVAPVKP
jgi:hypothetical protein